jgi:Holliday junction resolvasome RuvABC endonuclease subunit
MAKKVARPKDWSKVEWQPTDVLAFDPALANTGWAFVHFFAWPISPILGGTGTFVTKPEEASSAGIIGSLERGDTIFTFASSLMKAMDPTVVMVHETPVNQSNAAYVHKSEGGPVSAMAIRAAMRNNGFEPQAIEVQTWKKRLTDNGHADLHEVAAVIAEIFPGLKRSNEHVRAAIGCAIGFMIKAERWTEHE